MDDKAPMPAPNLGQDRLALPVCQHPDYPSEMRAMVDGHEVFLGPRFGPGRKGLGLNNTPAGRKSFSLSSTESLFL
jgi:hypothetical protein